MTTKLMMEAVMLSTTNLGKKRCLPIKEVDLSK
jgi:hypothetical protein